MRPDGAFHHFTINNNDVFPIDGMPGTFLALAAGSKGSTKVKILQTDSEIIPSELLIKKKEINYRE